MGQMQQMAPKMPPGGFMPPPTQQALQRRPQMNPGIMGQMQRQAPMPREQITREQIMARGLPQLPNPGPARPTMTGMAEGGIVHFQEGGYSTTPGFYMPKVKGKGAIANLQYAPLRPDDSAFSTRPPRNTSVGLYQDYPIGDFEKYSETIAGLDFKNKRDPQVIEDIQETFETPYDSEIARLKESIDSDSPIITNPFSGGPDAVQRSFDKRRTEDQIADLEYQKGLWFEGKSDNLIKQRGMKNPESNESFVFDDTVVAQQSSGQGSGQGSGFSGLAGERMPNEGDIPPGAMTKEEMLLRGYNKYNPAGFPVEPVKDYTISQYQKDLEEANKAFGIESSKDFFANRRKLIEAEKEDIRKEQQDDLNTNLMMTGLNIMETGDIAGGARRGVERYALSAKDSRKMKKLVDKEARASDGMERAEQRGDARGFMKERKVRKDTQLAQIKLNLDSYGNYLKSQADQFGKRNKDWIDAVNAAEKIIKKDGSIAARYQGNEAGYKRDIYKTAMEIFRGGMPRIIDAGTANTRAERGPNINTDRKPLTSFQS